MHMKKPTEITYRLFDKIFGGNTSTATVDNHEDSTRATGGDELSALVSDAVMSLEVPGGRGCTPGLTDQAQRSHGGWSPILA